jgi:hypothetical protein
VTYRIVGGYLVAAWIGICFATGYIYYKLPTLDATMFVGYLFVYISTLFGGMIFIAREWGVGFGMIFVSIWIGLLIIFGKKILRTIPIFNLVETFDEIIKTKW